MQNDFPLIQNGISPELDELEDIKPELEEDELIQFPFIQLELGAHIERCSHLPLLQKPSRQRNKSAFAEQSLFCPQGVTPDELDEEELVQPVGRQAQICGSKVLQGGGQFVILQPELLDDELDEETPPLEEDDELEEETSPEEEEVEEPPEEEEVLDELDEIPEELDEEPEEEGQSEH